MKVHPHRDLGPTQNPPGRDSKSGMALEFEPFEVWNNVHGMMRFPNTMHFNSAVSQLSQTSSFIGLKLTLHEINANFKNSR